MPVRFTCSECGGRLTARDDKIGRQLKCPKCRALITVPTAEEAARRDPTDDLLRQLETELAVQDETYLPELVVYDDEQEGEDESRRSGVDRERVSVSRLVIYLQACLIAAVALFGLTVGFMIGRTTAPTSAPVEEPIAREAATVEGRLQYRAAQGIQPDRGGVVIALPAGDLPGEKIPIDDLTPQSIMPRPENLTLQQITNLGGDYARADASGRFSVFLIPGEYHVLSISYAARRPNGNPAAREDLAEIGAYFTSAYELIGPHRYRWQTINIDAATRLDVMFE